MMVKVQTMDEGRVAAVNVSLWTENDVLVCSPVK